MYVVESKLMCYKLRNGTDTLEMNICQSLLT